MATLFRAPSVNYPSSNLNGGISDTVQTITVNSTTNLTSPSYAVIDRENGTGTATPNAREVIYYTGIAGNDLTGVTRGADGSTARTHADGALIEWGITVGMWNSLVSITDGGLDNNGYLRALASPVSIARMESRQLALNSIVSATRAEISNAVPISALVSIATVNGQLNASGASIVGFPYALGFNVNGSISGATTGLMVKETTRAGNWDYVNMITRTVSSGASMYVDINKNGTSIFDAGTRPVIAGGGTFYSSASILTKNFDRGDRMTFDFDGEGGGVGHITDFDVWLISQ